MQRGSKFNRLLLCNSVYSPRTFHKLSLVELTLAIKALYSYLLITSNFWNLDGRVYDDKTTFHLRLLLVGIALTQYLDSLYMFYIYINQSKIQMSSYFIYIIWIVTSLNDFLRSWQVGVSIVLSKWLILYHNINMLSKVNKMHTNLKLKILVHNLLS